MNHLENPGFWKIKNIILIFYKLLGSSTQMIYSYILLVWNMIMSSYTHIQQFYNVFLINILSWSKPAWKAWGCKSCLPWLPLATYPYLWLPFLTFGYLWLPLVTFPYLLLPFRTFGYLSVPFLTFPHLSLPFLTFTGPYWALLGLILHLRTN